MKCQMDCWTVVSIVENWPVVLSSTGSIRRVGFERSMQRKARKFAFTSAVRQRCMIWCERSGEWLKRAVLTNESRTESPKNSSLSYEGAVFGPMWETCVRASRSRGLVSKAWPIMTSRCTN